MQVTVHSIAFMGSRDVGLPPAALFASWYPVADYELDSEHVRILHCTAVHYDIANANMD